jgi:hypothetical protein
VFYQKVVDRLTHQYGARNARPRCELLEELEFLADATPQSEHNMNATWKGGKH